ncbi:MULTISPECIES: Rop family plasmid primer RNA-binding protein [Enterobacteriaceae]|nr:Rop family plasmid primer RNA-binding protein [Escherichia coli]NKD23223.1 Rop family plasmid primer RNA-binding protein [Enterobacter asburiae]HAY5546212.1 Rop family plasmid primer RNA-binding protein [Escherichia coli]HDS9612870.1 Rop family plasmid primer RNA-binding protein [Enterobacter roggenkampii]
MYLILGAGQLDLDNEADLCEKLHEGAEDLYRVLSARLNVCRDSA